MDVSFEIPDTKMTLVSESSRIWVDSREPPSVFEALDANKINYQQEFLDTADFIIETESRVLFIERKTRQDLCASIIDGRYYSQKSKMIQAAESVAPREAVCIFILEGTDTMSPRYEKMFCGAVSSLVASGLFSVLFSNSINGTINLIQGMSNKILKEQVFTAGAGQKAKARIASAKSDSPFASLPGIGPKSLKEISQYLAGKSLAQTLTMSHSELRALGVSSRTATAIVKVASLIA